MASSGFSCNGCKQQFTSKNQLFRHLKQSAKTCLPPDEYQDFLTNIINNTREKIGVLYGYYPGSKVEGGDHAAALVVQAIDRVSRGVDGNDNDTPNNGSDATISSNINRSYGSTSRGAESVAQDPNTGAITEVLCTYAVPLFTANDTNVNGGNDSADKQSEEANNCSRKLSSEWVASVNKVLDQMLAKIASSSLRSAGRIRIFGRVAITQKKFNAETDTSHRRIDYCFPADLLFIGKGDMPVSKTALKPPVASMQEYFDSLPTFMGGNNTYAQPDSNDIVADDQTCLDNGSRPSKDTLTYFIDMKKMMRKVTTQVQALDETDPAAVVEKEFHNAKRRRKKQKGSKSTGPPETTDKCNPSQDNTPNKPKRLLKRRRFHNFCPRILAHDFLAYRRVDRIYHRATIRCDHEPADSKLTNRPFIVLSLTGDIFLQEQAVRVIGLLIAIFRGFIDDDIIDCMFDEEYTGLVPAPPAPHIGMISGEATYNKWEGKMKTVLNSRKTDRYDKGWNDEEVVNAVEEWEATVLNDASKRWYHDGISEDGSINTVNTWLENVLQPWAEKTAPLLEDYRLWKASKNATHPSLDTSILPTVKSINPEVSPLFEKVLHYLREANLSGNWPTTTPNRQLVMLSTANDESQAKALHVVHMAAKKNKQSRSSAYSFKEGLGGASGSFSVGAMPGEQCSQPKGNLLFPELVKASFELEVALRPDREPSSTIAINRNAQFRPHTDNGAGAGQSVSLIVGLGDYAGGELVVEGAKKDIRYKAVEFDGWKERHWTLPFQGERYSLVWFTPKGCEGIRGIDLDLGEGKG